MANGHTMFRWPPLAYTGATAANSCIFCYIFDDFSPRLQDRRDEINKLSSTHVMLKKLQFLFELPAQLKDAIDKENYKQVNPANC